MSQQRAVAPRPLPPALIWAGSAVIVFHFLAILMLVLAAQSGPWATVHFGDSPAEGPMFAAKVNSVLAPWYLQPLRMTHNYHFASNRVTMPEIFFEARLKDDQGNVTTLKFPDPDASWWIRHRHSLLAMGLGDDILVQNAAQRVDPSPRAENADADGLDSRAGRKQLALAVRGAASGAERSPGFPAVALGLALGAQLFPLSVPRLWCRLGRVDPPQQGSSRPRDPVFG